MQKKKEKREAKAVDGFWPGTLAALYMRVIQAAVHALPPSLQSAKPIYQHRDSFNTLAFYTFIQWDQSGKNTSKKVTINSNDRQTMLK